MKSTSVLAGMVIAGLLLATPQISSAQAVTPQALRMFDLDGDGLLDRLLNGPDGTLEVQLNLGSRQFEPIVQVLPRVIVRTVLAEDLNGDGSTDLYLVSPGENAALVGDGSGRFVESTQELGLADAGQGLSAERLDVDGDGLLDLLLHNQASDVLFWAMAGGGFEREERTLAGVAPPVSLPLVPDVQPSVSLEEPAPSPTESSDHARTDYSFSEARRVIAGSAGSGLTSTMVAAPTTPSTLPIMPISFDARYVNDNENEVDSADIVDGSLTGADVSTSSGDVTFGGGAMVTAQKGVFGLGSVVSGNHATVSGGYYSTASGNNSTVSGGHLNTASAYSSTVSGGWRNTASSYAATVCGGSFNEASGYYSTTCGGSLNIASGNHSTVSGGRNNTASNLASTVSGGGINYASGSYSTVSGGLRNHAVAPWSTSLGGYHNGAQGFVSTISGGYRNTALGRLSTISGGFHNVASGYYSTVAGGGSYSGGNTAYGDCSTVSGGDYNSASGSNSTVSGGRINQALGTSSTIGGGYGNAATETNSTVSGGGGNNASGSASTIGGGYFNTASNTWSTVSGGTGNISMGAFSTVSGGGNNTAAGNRSTVPGGAYNHATGDFSFAAGRRSQAHHEGAFVWGDSANVDKNSSANDEFNVYCSGGARFFSNSAATAGVLLAPGGSTWSMVSDRNAKENLNRVDEVAVLEKVVGLPISTWNYKEQSDTVRHMGPMAQDFYAAFGLGLGDKTIDTIDPNGVALAAIQGLYGLLQERESRIEELEARQGVLDRQVAHLLELLDGYGTLERVR